MTRVPLLTRRWVNIIRVIRGRIGSSSPVHSGALRKKEVVQTIHDLTNTKVISRIRETSIDKFTGRECDDLGVKYVQTQESSIVVRVSLRSTLLT